MRWTEMTSVDLSSQHIVGFAAAGCRVVGASRQLVCRRSVVPRRSALVTLWARTEPASNGKGRGIPVDRPTSTIWEVDFYSRPILDKDGKKVWELIVTDKNGIFQHVEAVPNSMATAEHLKEMLGKLIDESTNKPEQVRFFRAETQNLISTALSGIDNITVTPSRKTYSLFKAIERREKTVYPNMSGYQRPLFRNIRMLTKAGTSAQTTESLPESFRGDKHGFLTVQLGELKELSPDDFQFGELCPIPDHLADDTPIPGICVYSRNAQDLARWLMASEIASASVGTQKRDIVLQGGLDATYRLALIPGERRPLAKKYEELMVAAEGLHFLAVHTPPEDEEVVGFWTMVKI